MLVRYPDGRGRRFGDGKGPSIVVHLRRPEAFWRKLGTRTTVGFGQSYVDGDWERPGMTLEEGQPAKIRRVCEKLALGPADHVLEIGCGWCGFAIQAAREYGCRITGLTLSPSQADFARERVTAAGLDDLFEIREQDYRITEGRFTKIASIEMFEATGLAEYGNYFSAIDRLLDRDGLTCIQTIGVSDWRVERYRRRPDWIQQYIFPGSLLPSLGSIAEAVATTRMQIVLSHSANDALPEFPSTRSSF